MPSGGTSETLALQPDGMAADPEDYVASNQETLHRIIKHSSKSFPRALALAAIVEYGDDAAGEDLVTELEQLRELTNDE